MSSLRNILNKDSSTPLPNDSCDSYRISSFINDHPNTTMHGQKTRGLERMSLDFIAPGCLSAPNRASQGPFHSAGYAHYSYSADNSHLPRPTQSQHIQDQYSDACVTASAQHSPWTSAISTSNYRRLSTTGSTDYTESESVDTSDNGSPSANHQRSPGGSFRNFHTHTPGRETRHAYGEEERAFIMVCAILRGLTWMEIEKEFRERFPAGQERRHQEAGLWPTYPKQERTASGLTCAYYRIRRKWGISKARSVSGEQKSEIKAVVKKTILDMHDFPDLQNYAQQCSL